MSSKTNLKSPKFWLKPPILSASVSLVLEQMGNNILSSNHPNKALYALVLFGVVSLMQRVGATEFNVGDASGWTVPNDPNAFNNWATKHRFQIGDSLLFAYPSGKDSVFQVNEDDYNNCNIASPIAPFTDGNTLFKFSKSGSHFFISGIKDNCLKNEKMHVKVLADRNNKSSNTTQAPVGDESPSPPSPTCPNGASSTFLSVFGYFVASSSLLLAL